MISWGYNGEIYSIYIICINFILYIYVYIIYIYTCINIYIYIYIYIYTYIMDMCIYIYIYIYSWIIYIQWPRCDATGEIGIHMSGEIVITVISGEWIIIINSARYRWNIHEWGIMRKWTCYLKWTIQTIHPSQKDRTFQWNVKIHKMFQ